MAISVIYTWFSKISKFIEFSQITCFTLTTASLRASSPSSNEHAHKMLKRSAKPSLLNKN